MKAKYLIIFLLIFSMIFFGSVIIAQETDATEEEATEEETTEAEATEEEATAEEETMEEEATEAEATEEETTEAASLEGFVKARLVSINRANSYTIILNGQEMVVSLLGLDFTESDFYIFDNKHYQYAEWLMRDYMYVWVDYKADRTNERGNPLVYMHYGPWETEVWADSTSAGHATAQTPDVYPMKISFWGEPLEVYDHNVAEPFMNDPEFSSVFVNWAPNYDPKEFGSVFKETYETRSGKTRTRVWHLRDLNSLMLLSGYADVDGDMEFDRKAEYSNHVAKAKWCRRGLWHILLKPNPDNEEVCGIKSLN